MAKLEIDLASVPVVGEHLDFEVFESEIVLYNSLLGNVIYLNPSAAFIWGLCDGQTPIRGIIDAIAAEFPGDLPNLRQEVVTTIQELLADGGLSLLDVDETEALVDEPPTFSGDAPPADIDAAPERGLQVATARKKLFPETEARFPGRLTVGMATFDDFDGVYFTIQAMRLMNSEIMDDIEFIIVDNNPTGIEAAHLHQLSLDIPRVRYIPAGDWSGTAVKNKVFEEAANEVVMVVDSHVLVTKGALSRVLDILEKDPDNRNLIHGPMLYDDLRHMATHHDPIWSGGFFGVVAFDPRGADPDGPCFDIVSMGMGLFACRREHWPRFNERFRGYGGEEGYMQEKFRQRGGRTLCYPFLRWAHRAARPRGIPYPLQVQDAVRNAYVGHVELGLDPSAMQEHFCSQFDRATILGYIEAVKVELAGGSEYIDHKPVPQEQSHLWAYAPSKRDTVFAKTAARYPGRITVGMACYDDFDGVYFTIQAMRMSNPDVADAIEFLIIDNNPLGIDAYHLHQLSLSIPRVRYIPAGDWSGTAIKNKVFEEAANDVVMVVDCHVLVAPGAISRVLEILENAPDNRDLIQGPMWNDDLKHVGTHLEGGWRGGSFGVYGYDPRATDVDGPAFEIPAMGMGLFACRREHWPRFNELWRGYGGEEGYMQEKFRMRGGRALCYPFLRWAHRAARPRGITYPQRWEDHLRNSYIGCVELGQDTTELEEHFKQEVGKRLGVETVSSFLDGVRAELAMAGRADGTIPAWAGATGQLGAWLFADRDHPRVGGGDV